MRRLVALVVVGAAAAAALATWGGAAPAQEAATAKADATLPALPANIKARGRMNIGIKCDAPPFGYIDVQGRNAGFEVEIARWFSRFAWGKSNRITFTCLTTPAREPSLTTDRVDMVLATFTYTTDRDTRIDFSRAYYKATGRLLVKNDGPVQNLNDINGRTVATTSGSIYDRWIKNCFKDTKLLVTDSFTNALLAFNQGRADTLMWDDTVLVGIATTDRTTKLTADQFLLLPYGIGIKQGNTALKRWIDSRLEIMRKKDAFNTILRNNVPARLFAGFQKNILRPNQTFTYSPGDVTTVCP
jgi:polar amino acid transport system substrate-binding protein